MQLIFCVLNSKYTLLILIIDIVEVKERELMSNRFGKYIAIFYYLDRSLIVLSTTIGGISISSFATVIGAPVGIVKASFRFEFSATTGIIKTLLKTTQSKKESILKLLR